MACRPAVCGAKGGEADILSHFAEAAVTDIAKDLLFGELRHRMKNLFAVIQSLAARADTEGRSAEEYRNAFLGRLNALIDAEELAFAEREDVGFKELLERIFAPYSFDPGAVVIEPGEAVLLAPRTIMALGLILHEMATNAAKYGALSVPEGQVRIAWATAKDSTDLKIRWIENGGPTVAAPAAPSYGTTLIQSTATYNLRGHVELDYAADGLQAEIVIPLDQVAPELTAHDVDDA